MAEDQGVENGCSIAKMSIEMAQRAPHAAAIPLEVALCVRELERRQKNNATANLLAYAVRTKSRSVAYINCAKSNRAQSHAYKILGCIDGPF